MDALSGTLPLSFCKACARGPAASEDVVIAFEESDTIVVLAVVRSFVSSCSFLKQDRPYISVFTSLRSGKLHLLDRTMRVTGSKSPCAAG